MVVGQRQQLFRKKALEQSASPEQLDQLVQVVNPKRWLSLAALGTLVAAGIAWSVLGRIPMTVSGRGILTYPSEVSALQASSTGRILAFNVKVGDTVKKGQVIAIIDQSELQNELQLARNKLAQLQLQDQAARSAQSQRGSLEQTAIAQQRQTLRQRLQTEQNLTPVLQQKAQESIQRERQALNQQLDTLQSLIPTYRERWNLRQELTQEGALSRDDALDAEREYQEIQQQLNQVESQLKELDVKEAEAQREYLRNVNQVADLQAQLQELDTRQATQAEQDLVTATNRQKEIQEMERTIAQLELELQRSSQIVSTHDGQILELSAQPGQQLEAGMSIGVIAAYDPNDALMSIAFLPVSEGMKVKPGMALQTTPSIVKREEHGGIWGTVVDVSDYPVTQQGAASLVGNPDILPGVMGEGPHLAVYAKLETQENGEFRWSASAEGPEQDITSGMTTSVRITVDERTPLSFVLPILKSWAGLS